MSTDPPSTKTMLVNCNVYHSFNFFPPANMNPSVTLVMVCWSCRCIRPFPQVGESIACPFCGATTNVRYHDLHSLPKQHSRKRAVICGISYQKSSYELKGSIQNAKWMKEILIDRFEFSGSDIVMLTEDERDQGKTPTKCNLLRALYWLGRDCQQGDSLVFHYIGHGLRRRNYRLREVDGYNETLCPKDFETEGMIFDDEINAVIVGHLPDKVKLHAIIDSCHKDSVLDLRFLCRKNRRGQYEWENHSPRSDVFKGTSGGDAISFSGYVDVRTFADTPEQLLSKATPIGLTSRFIKAITKSGKRTYGSILDSMHDTISQASDSLKQEPLLSACGKFDVNSDIFTL